MGYFSCSNRDGRATLSAVYVENEDPVVKNILNINNHILKRTGLEHFVCYSEEYISTCKERILLKIRRTPEQPVLQIYEDCLNEFVSVIREQDDEELLENFTRGMPTEVQFVRTMYRLSYFRYQSL